MEGRDCSPGQVCSRPNTSATSSTRCTPAGQHSSTAPSCRPNRLGYMPQGSLIISRDPGATALLQQRAAELSSEGIAADVLTPKQCTELEPLLHIPDAGAGLCVAGDFQIDARSASAYLLQRCEELGAARNRFRVRFGCTVGRIAMDCCTGGVSGVTTSRGDVIAECAPLLWHARRAALSPLARDRLCFRLRAMARMSLHVSVYLSFSYPTLRIKHQALLVPST